MRSDAHSTTPPSTAAPVQAAVPAVGGTVGSTQRAASGVGYLVVLATREQTEGRTTELEAICGPGAPGVEERSFAGHEVRFEVLEGRLTIGVAGEARELVAGSALTLPAGTPHRIWVEDGRDPARFTWCMRPAAETDELTPLVFGEPAAV